MHRWLARVLTLWLCGLVVAGCDRDTVPPEAPPAGPVAPSPVPSPAPAPTPGPPVTLPGATHDLALTIGDSCTVVPEAERTRRYVARFDEATGGVKTVTLGGPRFLSGLVCTLAGLDCNQFVAREDANGVRLNLGSDSEWHGGTIVEQATGSTWFEIAGAASGSGSLSERDLVAEGQGHVWYCPTPMEYPFPCRSFVACETDLRFAFRRRE